MKNWHPHLISVQTGSSNNQKAMSKCKVYYSYFKFISVFKLATTSWTVRKKNRARISALPQRTIMPLQPRASVRHLHNDLLATLVFVVSRIFQNVAIQQYYVRSLVLIRYAQAPDSVAVWFASNVLSIAIFSLLILPPSDQREGWGGD